MSKTKRRVALGAALAGVAAGVAGVAAFASDDRSPLQSGVAPDRGHGGIEASWIDSAGSLAGLRDKSDVVVVATVSQVAEGPFSKPQVTRPDSDADPLPSRRIILTVDRKLAHRNTSMASTIEVIQLGDERSFINEDPPYRVGDKYILGLVRRPDGKNLWRPVGPDARLLITGTRVGTWVEGPLRRELAELEAADAAKTVEQELGETDA